MAGLFGFLLGQSSDTLINMDEVKNEASKTVEDSSGLTGVAKYLQAQKPAPAATGVAKYLRSKEQNVPSGVAKYLARQAVRAKQKVASEAADTTATGVARYLKKQESRPKVVKSGVEKYLANRKPTSLSGVAKYLANKKILAKDVQPAVSKTTGVSKYLDTRKEVLATGVSKYIVRQTLAARRLAEETVAVAAEAVVEPVTGVEKYLRARG